MAAASSRLVLVLLTFFGSLRPSLGDLLGNVMNYMGFGGEQSSREPAMAEIGPENGIEFGMPMEMSFGMPVAVGMGPNGPVHMRLVPMGMPPPLIQARMIPGGSPGLIMGEDPFQFSPFENFDDDVFGLLGKVPGGGANMTAAGQAGGFVVDRENGHFTLRASLPGYNMHSTGEAESDQPLSVEVVGHSLVVRGRQTHDHSSRSFQRSFRLPRNADQDAIHVTYNVTDGSLAVDIPGKVSPSSNSDASASVEEVPGGGDDEEVSESFDERTGTRITTIKGGGPRGMPFPPLPGGPGGFISALMGDMAQMDGPPMVHLQGGPVGFLARKPTAGDDPFAHDPFMGMLRGMIASPDEMEEHMARWNAVVNSTEELEKKASLAPSEAQENVPAVQPAPPTVAGSVEQPAQSQPVAAPAEMKAASAPYWRRPVEGDDSTIEIVVPKGVRVGEPDGRHLPCFNSKASSARPAGAPDWTVELPVSIHTEQCSWHEDDTDEQVLSCQIKKTSVKKVPIKVIDDSEL